MKNWKMIIVFTLAITICFFLMPKLKAGIFPFDTDYEVCFTPDYDCTSWIVSELNRASKTIRVQAYTFTSEPIEQALVDAKLRGIDVQVLLDKTQKKLSYDFFQYNGIAVWIDYQPQIAHNKIIIVDNYTVITGSFNFTYAANHRNAENMIMIHDEGLANQYTAYWNKRKALSSS